MVYTVAQQEPGAVVVTVLAPVTVDDSQVLCRAVKEMLRSRVGHLVVDLRHADLGQAALTTAARIHGMCCEHQVECTLVAQDPAGLRRALRQDTRTDSPAPIAATVEQALTATLSECADDTVERQQRDHGAERRS